MEREASANGHDAGPQVFISYARQDAERVLAIARSLEGQGATVWRDADRILGGQYYGEQIVHAIAHSKVVMLMCSPQAFSSDNVHREVLLTWDHYHRRYLPVWLGPPTEIPERFRYCLVGCQWVDASSQPPDQWLPQLLRALRALGVETGNPGGPAGGATPTPGPSPTDPPAAESPRRTLRFRPGDRPILGADWELERLLGKGGFGEVWKARNPHLTGLAPVALKFCLALDDRSRELLRHEANMVLQVQRQIRSDGIVPLLHAYLGNDPPCLEFPYIEGGTLVGLLDECRASSAGSFAPLQAQRIIQRIAEIVGPAHRATPKLIHRDLKPSNVMVERKEDRKVVLRVTDFGIGAISAQPVLEESRASSSLEGNLSSVLTGSYSPLYASPQQMRGDGADPRDDVYALGVIWYQLLKGDLASPAPTGRRWMELLRDRRMGDAAIELLSSCFESEPTYRPADAGILAEQLRVLSASTPTKSADVVIELAGVPTPPAPEPVAKPEPVPSVRPTNPTPSVAREELAPDPKPVVPPPPVPSEPAARTPPGPASPQRRTAAKPASPAPPIPMADASPRPVSSAALPRGDKGSRRRAMLAAGLLGLFGFLGIVLYVVTDHGTVKITGTDPGMKVLIDGGEIRIENLGRPITIRTGPHKLLVRRDGLETRTEEFSIRRGDEKVLDVTYIPRPSNVTAPIVTDHRESPSTPREVVPRSKPPVTDVMPPLRKSAVAAPREVVSPSKPVTDTANVPSPPDLITTRVGRIELKRIPDGEVMMGSPAGDDQASDDEKPQHRVQITRPFYLGVYEITQAQYQAVMGVNPSYFSSKGGGKDEVAGQSTDRHPVENVFWLDAVTFCNKLSELEGRKPFYEIDGQKVRVPNWDGPGYRLPTEAEWEYACRAGTRTRYSFGDDEASLREYSWFDGNSGMQTHPVGEKRRNEFGLFDMHGNVYEWCWDGLDEGYYRKSAAVDLAHSGPQMGLPTG